MSAERFDHLLRLVDPLIKKNDTIFRKAVSSGEKLSLTLCYLATGESQQSLSFGYRLGRTTVCHAIRETCNAIWEVLSCEFLRSPSTKEEWAKISQDFQDLWNLPHCIGAID